jgi:hypothetical protein
MPGAHRRSSTHGLVPGIDGFLAAEQDRPDIPAKARMAHAVRVPRPDPIDVDAFLEACRGQGIPAWRNGSACPRSCGGSRSGPGRLR